MVYQTTEGVDPIIRKAGCYWRDVLRIFEILTKTLLTVDQVNEIFQLCITAGFIGSTGWMKEEAGKGVAGIASGYTGNHCYIKRVFNAEDANFIISKHTLNGPHFSLEKGPLNALFDPWSAAGSNTRSNGKLDSFRYYFGEAI